MFWDDFWGIVNDNTGSVRVNTRVCANMRVCVVPSSFCIYYLYFTNIILGIKVKSREARSGLNR